MQILETVESLRAEVLRWRSEGKRIALVPTMGNLHAGHLRLVEAAKQHADRIVVTIFVNPTQFSEGEDFDSYSRTFEEDARKLLAAQTDLLFAPAVAEIYPVRNRTVVEVQGISDILCGAFRPGHFSGVATIVCKLLNLVQPDDAFFGEKDFQQLTVIRCMVTDLNIPARIHGVETVREADGLAMSSRNGYLSPKERLLAPNLYQALCAARDEIAGGALAYGEIEAWQMERLRREGFNPDYFCVRRRSDLSPPAGGETELMILAAAWLGKARLIDNLKVTRNEKLGCATRLSP